jgi:hypothetical protein
MFNKNMAARKPCLVFRYMVIIIWARHVKYYMEKEHNHNYKFCMKHFYMVTITHSEEGNFKFIWGKFEVLETCKKVKLSLCFN